MASQVLINGYDLTEFITGIPEFINQRSYDNNLTVLTDFNIDIDNTNQKMNPLNYLSFFYNKYYRMPLTVYIDNIKRFEGYINKLPSVSYNSAIANLTVSNFINEVLNNTYIEWVHNSTITPKTPAEILKEILENYGLKNYINYPSFSNSISYQESQGFYINCMITKDDNMNLFTCLQQFSELSNSDIYINNNKIYHKVYTNNYSPVSSLTIESNYINDIKLEFPILEEFTGYNITTLQGTASKDTGNNIKSLSFDTNSALQILSIESGFNLGENYLNKLNRRIINIELELSSEFNYFIDLNTNFTIETTKINLNNNVVIPLEISFNPLTRITTIKGFTYET